MNNRSHPAGILLVLVAVALVALIVYAARPVEPTVVEPIRIRAPDAQRNSPEEKRTRAKRKKEQRPARGASPAPAPAPAPPDDDRDDDDDDDDDDDSDDD